jgi:hypothetical protein
MSAPSKRSRWSRGPAIIAAAILLGTGLVAAPASAATTTASPKTAGVCDYGVQYVTVGTRQGRFKCFTTVRTIWWPAYPEGFPFDGRQEAFGIGLDGVVYHAWQRYPGDTDWDGWYELGGHDVAQGVAWRSFDPPEVEVIGSDNICYYKSYEAWRNDWSYWIALPDELC